MSRSGSGAALVGDLLRESYASPQLRAALYQVGANLPGVQLIGAAKDKLGGSGIAVAYTNVGIRHELIFDPGTSAPLGERTVVVDPAQQAGRSTATAPMRRRDLPLGPELTERVRDDFFEPCCLTRVASRQATRRECAGRARRGRDPRTGWQ
jgi:hypothetical protein